MRRLILFRHAKSERGQPGETDVLRVLNPRGERDAPRLGAFMVKHALPDLAVVSTAARTRQTWQLASAAFNEAPRAVFDDRIYEASPQRLLQVVKEAPQSVHTLLICGHNPGLEELAAKLIASGNVDAQRRLADAFPTAALAVIDFPGDSTASSRQSRSPRRMGRAPPSWRSSSGLRATRCQRGSPWRWPSQCGTRPPSPRGRRSRFPREWCRRWG
jgi:phosphohistidine phosphatase